MEYHHKGIIEHKLAHADTFLNQNWQDLGDVIEAYSITKVAIWSNVIINGGAGVQFRVLAGLRTNKLDGYYLPIRVVTTNKISIYQDIVELASNIDQKIIFHVCTEGLLPYIKIQARIDSGSGTVLDKSVITKTCQ